MKVIKTKINNINFNKDNVIISCNNYKLNIKITHGSYDINVKNTENDNLSIYDLSSDDIISVLYKVKDKEYIYPKNIIVNTKYTIIDDFSDDENIIF